MVHLLSCCAYYNFWVALLKYLQLCHHFVLGFELLVCLLALVVPEANYILFLSISDF
jgi:hypothetical protein